MTNTNNPLVLQLKVGLDETGSKAELNKQIEALSSKLSNLNLKIDIDPKAIAALSDLAKMDLSRFTKSAEDAQKSVSKVGDQAQTAGKEITKEFKDVQKSVEATFAHLSKNFRDAMRKGITDVDSLKTAFKGMEASFKMDYEVLGEDAAGRTIRRVKGIEATYKNLEGQIEKVKFKNDTLIDMGGGNSSPLWLPESTSKVVDSQIKDVAKLSQKVQQELDAMRAKGDITEKQFVALTGSLNRSMNTTDVQRVNSQLDAMVASNKQLNKELKEQELEQKRIIENEIKRKNLIADITKAQNSQSKTINKSASDNLLKEVQAMDVSAKNFGTVLKQNQSSLRQLKADATEASRQNIGVMNAFKTAMEKFPIWMAASTIFYGTVRTAREFMSIIVDIDSKMTDLAKVMDEGTDFEALFDRATQSAERFGQSISQVLDSYTEFARQGYNGDELGVLADAGLVASNVGDITAQKASEYMTASLIQWKKDAKEAMGIIDSWNEISNNYATTTEKLAQGQARAGATARAMGLDFDQLNAIIGTVTASTKQSGKLHCPYVQQCA